MNRWLQHSQTGWFRQVFLGLLLGGVCAPVWSVVSLAPPLSEQALLPVKDASAETLHSVIHSQLLTNNQWQRQIYTSIRINDLAAARDYGRIALTYNHYYSNLVLEFARTRSASGAVVEVSMDAVQRRVTGGGQDFYSDRSELVFSLPDIAPGSILEFQYTKASVERPFAKLFSEYGSPHWAQETVGQDGWRADYVHQYTHRLDVPKGVRLYTKQFSGMAKPAKKSLEDTIRYTWKMRAVAGFTSERNLPKLRTLMPFFQASTLRDWREVDRWAWDKIQDKLPSTQALENIVADMGLPITATPEDKVRAVYAYVQHNVRYVFAHLGRGGYTPHFPDAVIKKRYGDCKDQAVLAVALLNLMGVKAYPALIETPRAGDSDTDLVRLIFDHMIVHIPSDQGVSVAWMDTTADRSLFPGTSYYLSEQNTFIVNGAGGELRRFPRQAVSRGHIEIQGFTQDNGAYVANIEIRPTGFFEQNIRSWWKHTKDQKNALLQYLKGLYSPSSEAHIEAEVRFAEDLFHPVEISAMYRFEPDSDSSEVYGASAHQLFRLYSDHTDLPLPETRQFGFEDPYPYRLSLSAQFTGKDSTFAALIQSADDLKTPYYELSHQGKAAGNQYALSIDFTRNPLFLTQAEYAGYFTAMAQLNQTQGYLVKMMAKPSGTTPAVVKSAMTNKTSSVIGAEDYLAKARQYMEAGEFNKALEPAQRAVAAAAADGEAWYVLGTVQGLNTLIDEAEQSFKKAEELGFYPQ